MSKGCTRLFVIRICLFVSVISWACPTYSGTNDKTIEQKVRELDQMYAKEHAKNWYPEIKKISLGIMSRYPSDEYVYVGVGRSPTPLIMFFQQINPALAFNVPLSRAPRPMNKLLLMHRADQLFNRFIWDAGVLRSGKKILLIDFVLTGSSLRVANLLLNHYLIRHGIKRNVIALALTKSPQALDPRFNFDSFLLSYQEDASFYSTQYDVWSQYGTFDITNSDHAVSSLQPRENYEMLSREFRINMMNDESIEMRDLLKTNDRCNLMLTLSPN